MQKKPRKYYRKCGVCKERHEQSEMQRDEDSPNGWICQDCIVDRNPEQYFDWGLYPNF